MTSQLCGAPSMYDTSCSLQAIACIPGSYEALTCGSLPTS